MAKTRLTKSMRERMLDFVLSKVNPTLDNDLNIPSLKKALEKHILARVKEEYPVKDMKVLEKYKMAKHCDCVYFTFEDHHHRSSFSYCFKTNVIFRPSDGCISIRLDKEIAHTYIEAKKLFDIQYKEKKSAYYRILYSVNYFEDLLDVIPVLKDYPLPKKNVSLMVIPENLKAEVAEDMKRITEVMA